jgi:hypothetical protein
MTSEGKVTLRPARATTTSPSSSGWRSASSLDHILVLNEGHLRRTLTTYIDYYETTRPHQGLNQQMPVLSQPSRYSGPVQKRKVLGGIISYYYPLPVKTLHYPVSIEKSTKI